MRMILFLTLLAIVPPLQAAAPPTSPVRLTLDEASRRACAGLHHAKALEMRAQVLQLYWELLLAAEEIRADRLALPLCVEGAALVRKSFERDFFLQACDTYKNNIRFSEQRSLRVRRSLAELLGIAPHRELILLGPGLDLASLDEERARMDPERFFADRALLESILSAVGCHLATHTAPNAPVLRWIARAERYLERERLLREMDHECWLGKMVEIQDREYYHRGLIVAYQCQYEFRRVDLVLNRTFWDFVLESIREQHATRIAHARVRVEILRAVEERYRELQAFPGER